MDTSALLTMLQASAAYTSGGKAEELESMWAKCSAPMYSLDAGVMTGVLLLTHDQLQVRSLGFDDEGISTYYSANVSKAEAAMVQVGGCSFLTHDRLPLISELYG